jgi:hypothetical protein
MKHSFFSVFLILVACISCREASEQGQITPEKQPQYPPYPVVMLHPNVNVWSPASLLYNDHLQDEKKQQRSFVGMLRVDGKAYRFMGIGKIPETMIAGMSYNEEWAGKYTFTQPNAGWQTANYDDSDWDEGKSPFGTLSYHSEYYNQINTLWPTKNIWIRRKVKINKEELVGKQLYLRYSHDDVFELYINGRLAVKTGNEFGENKQIELSEEITKTFNTDEITVAAYVQNLTGDGLADFGIFATDNVGREWEGKYTFSQPDEAWKDAVFDDSSWNLGKSPFGTPNDYAINTVWNTPEIWVRRAITLSDDDLKKTLVLEYSHDDVFELYVNGISILKTGFEWGLNKRLIIPDSVKNYINDNKLLIAAHCKNASGGALVDVHFYSEELAFQKSVEMQATQTHYLFECGQVELKLDFIAPFLTGDIDLLSRPVNYISYNIASLDGQKHDVAIYFEISDNFLSGSKKSDCASELYVNNNLAFAKIGRKKQSLFEYDKYDGSPLWGYLFLCSDTANISIATGNPVEMRKSFTENSQLSSSNLSAYSKYTALSKSYGKIAKVSDKILLCYDEIFAAQYFGKNLYPYWNRKGNTTVEDVLAKANKDYEKIISYCNTFDENIANRQLFIDYRHIITFCRFAQDEKDSLLIFSPDGINDILNSASLLLELDCNLLKAQIIPFLRYCESDKWGKEYPPSNMGNYPLENGLITPSLSSVEATSDMLFILAMITVHDGNADFVRPYWPLISEWNIFLQKNFDKQEFRAAISRGLLAFNCMKTVI